MATHMLCTPGWTRTYVNLSGGKRTQSIQHLLREGALERRQTRPALPQRNKLLRPLVQKNQRPSARLHRRWLGRLRWWPKIIYRLRLRPIRSRRKLGSQKATDRCSIQHRGRVHGPIRRHKGGALSAKPVSRTRTENGPHQSPQRQPGRARIGQESRSPFPDQTYRH